MGVFSQESPTYPYRFGFLGYPVHYFRRDDGTHCPVGIYKQDRWCLFNGFDIRTRVHQSGVDAVEVGWDAKHAVRVDSPQIGPN